jgi:trans-aconitate methyltransferase
MDPDRWNPDGYLGFIRGEIPDYDRLQVEVSAATRGLEVSVILDLGAGTGETARRVVAEHPGALLVGTDESSTGQERPSSSRGSMERESMELCVREGDLCSAT